MPAASFFTATWPRIATPAAPAAVALKGSFDAWASEIPMLPAPSDSSVFVECLTPSAPPHPPFPFHPRPHAVSSRLASCRSCCGAATALVPLGSLKPGDKLLYKFIVDGVWRVSPNDPTEYDNAGNENNVYIVGSIGDVDINNVQLGDVPNDEKSPASVATLPSVDSDGAAINDSIVLETVVAEPVVEPQVDIATFSELSSNGPAVVSEGQAVSSAHQTESLILQSETIETISAVPSTKVDAAKDDIMVPLSVASVESNVQATQAVAAAVEPAAITASVLASASAPEPTKLAAEETVVSSPEFTLKSTSDTAATRSEVDSNEQKDLSSAMPEPQKTGSLPSKQSYSTSTPPSRRQSMPAAVTNSSARTSMVRDPRLSMASMDSFMTGGSGSSPPKSSPSPRLSPRSLLLRGVAFFKKDRATAGDSASIGGGAGPGSPGSAESPMSGAALGIVEEEDETLTSAAHPTAAGASAVTVPAEESKPITGGADIFKSLFGVGASKKKKSGKNKKKK
ncbi:hypothetical protein HDU84_006272 [Entophlyctis sp. JEL0112]|nr:hypothetical protein HDU84_006272 [Entophlyctis sp. JEL0112]